MKGYRSVSPTEKPRKKETGRSSSKTRNVWHKTQETYEAKDRLIRQYRKRKQEDPKPEVEF